MPAPQDGAPLAHQGATATKGKSSGGKVQPWKKFKSLSTPEQHQTEDSIFEYPESLIRLRCEADDKSLGD